MSLVLQSLRTIKRSLSRYSDPSPELISILREILYSSEEPQAIEECLETLQKLCCRCPDNKWILCERKDIFSQLLWIFRLKLDQAPRIYATSLILIQLCEKQFGRDEVKRRLVDHCRHVVGGLASDYSWYITLHTITYMIEEEDHALTVFNTPIPGKHDLAELMVIWLYNLYLHLSNGGTAHEAITDGITLLLLILSRCASIPSLRSQLADYLCRERVTDRQGISIFVPVLILNRKEFGRNSKMAAMGLVKAIADERPLLYGTLGPYCNFINKMRLSNWNLGKYQRTIENAGKRKNWGTPVLFQR